MRRIAAATLATAALAGAERVEAQVQSPSPPPPLQFSAALPLPAGVVPSDVALWARGSLVVKHDSLVTVPTGRTSSRLAVVNMTDPASPPSTNCATIQPTTLQRLEVDGNVYSDYCTLLDGTDVNGNLSGEQGVALVHGATVTGALSRRASIGTVPGATLAVSFPASSSGNYVLGKNRNATLAPGRYGDVYLNPNSRLTLTAGDYYLKSLDTDSNSTLYVDDGAGPVRIFIQGNAVIYGPMKVKSSDAARVLLAAFGSTHSIQREFWGTVVAPQGLLVIGGYPGATFHGAYFADSLVFEQFTTLFQVASSLLWEPRVAGSVSASVVLAIPGYDAGKLACDPGLTATGFTDPDPNVAGDEYYTALGYTTFPAGSSPDCTIQFCDDDENPITPYSVETLNAPAVPPNDSCPAIGGSGADCLVNPDTLGGTCQTSSDCSGGQVCAALCTDKTCKTLTHRCGSFYASCDGIPADSTNCDPREFRECAAPNTRGEVKQSDVLAQLPQQTAPQSTAYVPPAAKTTPPVFPDLLSQTLCNNRFVEHAPLVDTGENGTRSVDQGDDTWGVFFDPVFQHKAQLGRRELGDGTLDVGGTVGIVAGANIFGNRVEVVNANATIDVQRCGTKAGVTLKFLGDDLATLDLTGGAGGMVALSGADEGSIGTPTALRQACEDAEAARDALTESIRASMVVARRVQYFYEQVGTTTDLCGRTNKALGSTYDCAEPDLTHDVAIPNAWKGVYDDRIAKFVAAEATLANASNAVATTGELPLIELQHRYEVSILSFTVPIGPIPLTLAVDGYGQWSFAGGVEYSVAFGGAAPALLDGVVTTAPSSDDIRAFAGPVVTPGLDIGVSAFVGVGLPAVSIGIEGSIALLGFDLPFDARAGLMRVSEADARDVSASDWAGAAIAGIHDDRVYHWVTGWAYGAKADLDLLSGRIDLAARINLLFVKKTFRKKLFDWKGLELSTVIAGDSTGTPLQDGDEYGRYGDRLPFTALAALTSATAIKSADPTIEYPDQLALPEDDQLANLCGGPR